MRFRWSDRPFDRLTSDRLRGAARVGRPDGSGAAPADPLARLLAAAAAPPRPGELAGEQAALNAFRAARANPAPAPAPVRSVGRRRFTAGAAAWIAGFAVTATAGAAMAAVTLDRPGTPPRQTAPVQPPTGPGPAESPPTGGPQKAPPGSSPAASAPTVLPSRPEPVPGALGLCTAYLVKPLAERDRSLKSPTFSALVEAAGGPDRVDDYCRQLGPDKNTEPTKKAEPTKRSIGRPSTEPSR